MWDELDIEAYSNDIREALKNIETQARNFSNLLKTNDFKWDKWEVIAQSILALRHIEDARMRYGKVIQYSQDGVSIYDK